VVLLGLAAGAVAADEPLPQAAATALRRAWPLSQQVAAHGGYVYRYSADLSKREGEARPADTVWVQPPARQRWPGLLGSYQRTGEASLRVAARARASA